MNEIQLAKLEKVDIVQYGFSGTELIILALIKSHLNNVDEPSKLIEKALDSESGLASLIEASKESASGIVTYRKYKKKYESFLSNIDGEDFADKKWNAMKPFLQDCWEELEKCERAELLS